MNKDKDNTALQYQKILLKAFGIHAKFKGQAYSLGFVFSEYRTWSGERSNAWIYGNYYAKNYNTHLFFGIYDHRIIDL